MASSMSSDSDTVGFDESKKICLRIRECLKGGSYPPGTTESTTKAVRLQVKTHNNGVHCGT